MRRAGWSALALVVGGCTVAGPRPGEPGPGPGPRPDATAPAGVEPEVRVGIVVDSPSVRVEAAGAVEIVDAGGRALAEGQAGSAWTFRADGNGIQAVGGGGTVSGASPLLVRPVAEGEVVVNGTRYRGAVLVRRSDAGVTAVNVLDLETYLLGVVPHEIGSGRPLEELEAVKAQAVAARTYAVGHLGRRDALGFDFYATVQDQVYGGADADDPMASRAVRETRGEIVTYAGEPIEAYYHSTCGGRTAAIEEVWNGDPRPYLRSVSDARPGGGAYCETSNRYRWSESWTQAELLATLSNGLGAHLGTDAPVTEVLSLEVTERTTSERVGTLRIATNLGIHEVHGDSVRWILRPEPGRILNSSLIDVDPRSNAQGRVTSLTVDGAGWGHGIGMCQIGALGRARDGHSYRDILTTYYPGTRIARLYQ